SFMKHQSQPHPHPQEGRGAEANYPPSASGRGEEPNPPPPSLRGKGEQNRIFPLRFGEGQDGSLTAALDSQGHRGYTIDKNPRIPASGAIRTTIAPSPADPGPSPLGRV